MEPYSSSHRLSLSATWFVRAVPTAALALSVSFWPAVEVAAADGRVTTEESIRSGFYPSDTKARKSYREAAERALKANNYRDAERNFKSALQAAESLEPGDERLVESLDDLGRLYTDMRRHSESEPLFRRALETREKKWGPSDVRVGRLLCQIGWSCCHQGKHDDAERCYLRAKGIYELKLGRYHPAVGACLNGLAVNYLAAKKYAQAEPLFDRSLRIAESRDSYTTLDDNGNMVTYTRKPKPAECAAILHNLALTYGAQQKYSEAEKAFLQSIALTEAAYGKKNPRLVPGLLDLARFYLERKSYPSAEIQLKRSRTLLEKNQGPDLPYLVQALALTVKLYSDQGDLEAAKPYSQRLREVQGQLPPPAAR